MQLKKGLNALTQTCISRKRRNRGSLNCRKFKSTTEAQKKKKVKPFNKLEPSHSSMSQTLELSKKKKLTPIKKVFKMDTAVRTKAGTNGKQLKINQDIAIVEHFVPHGVRLYCVCDGHGLNGHMVSAFIKNHLISKYLANKERI